MEKKQYIAPVMETIDLQAIDVVMDHAFGEASRPATPYDPAFGAPKRRTQVF